MCRNKSNKDDSTNSNRNNRDKCSNRRGKLVDSRKYKLIGGNIKYIDKHSRLARNGEVKDGR